MRDDKFVNIVELGVIVAWSVYILLSLSAGIGIIYVAWHFIHKLW